jgi:POT family proton-dependent oligopeptide transporter
VAETDKTVENYIQNSKTDPLHPGALGLGQSTASMLVNVFLLLSYLTPIAAGIISDNYLGRFRTIRISLW